jgi:hypothetical protein
MVVEAKNTVGKQNWPESLLTSLEVFAELTSLNAVHFNLFKLPQNKEGERDREPSLNERKLCEKELLWCFQPRSVVGFDFRIVLLLIDGIKDDDFVIPFFCVEVAHSNLVRSCKF